MAESLAPLVRQSAEPEWLKNIEIREDIVCKIISRLTKQGLHHEGLFIDQGDTRKVTRLYRSFAAHSFEPSFSHCSAIELAAALKRYLCQTPTPIFLRYASSQSPPCYRTGTCVVLNLPASSSSSCSPLSSPPFPHPAQTLPTSGLATTSAIASLVASPSSSSSTSPPSSTSTSSTSSKASTSSPASSSTSSSAESPSNQSQPPATSPTTTTSPPTTANPTIINLASLNSTGQPRINTTPVSPRTLLEAPLPPSSPSPPLSGLSISSTSSPSSPLSLSPSTYSPSPFHRINLDEAIYHAFVRRGSQSQTSSDALLTAEVPNRTGFAVDLHRLQEIVALFLPPKQRRLLTIIIPFFRKVIGLSEYNGADVDVMAQILVRSLFSDADSTPPPQPPPSTSSSSSSSSSTSTTPHPSNRASMYGLPSTISQAVADGLGVFEFSLRLELSKCLIQFYSHVFEDPDGRRLTRTSFFVRSSAVISSPADTTVDLEPGDSDSSESMHSSQKASALARELRAATPQIVSVDDQTDEDSWPQNITLVDKPSRNNMTFPRVSTDDFRTELANGDSSIVQIYVTAPELVKGVRDYTAYRVVSNSKDEVLRRYSQFQRLQKSLVGAYPHIPVPEMPPKQFWGRFSTSFLESRRQNLQALMNHILSFPALRDSPQLREFLSEGYPS